MSGNPFTNELGGVTMSTIVRSNFQLACATVSAGRETTKVYSELVFFTLSHATGDALQGAYGMLWQLGETISPYFSGTLEISMDKPCDHAECADQNAVVDAFVSAAGRDDLDSCINVVKAVVNDCTQTETDPCQALQKMYARIMTAVTKGIVTAAKAAIDENGIEPPEII